MEQKRIIWIAAAVGIFLVVVVGAALILYHPAKKTETTIAALNPQSDTWVLPPTQPTDEKLKEVTVRAETANVYSDSVTTVDLNSIGNAITTVKEEQATQAAQSVNQAAQPAATATTPTIPLQPVPDVQNTIVVTPPKQPAPPVKQAETPKPAVQPAAVAKPTPTKKITVIEYWIQAGSFSDKKFAEQSRVSLTGNKINSEVFTADVNGKLYYRVRVGPYKTKSEAEYWLGFIKEDAAFAQSYITEVKIQK